MSGLRAAFIVIASAAIIGGVALWPGSGDVLPADPGVLHASPRPNDQMRVAPALRTELLRRASVRDIRNPRTSLFDSPGNDLHASIECRYLPQPSSGTTSKFDCVLGDGTVVKVKYGRTPEIQAEVAATRLLAHLGFGADTVRRVERVRCFGCPRMPFEVTRAAEFLRVRDALLRGYSPERAVDFAWVAVERRAEGTTVESEGEDGWAWFELDESEPDGDSRADRDALKLAAMLLAHWDNKRANQRLVCLDARDEAAEGCARPFAMVHDLGATFGPNKVDLAAWKQVPIWKEAATCTVSMRALPYGGGTFPDARISEEGRTLLLRELEGISQSDALAWFEGAGFTKADAWTRAFADKVRQIREAGPCTET